MNKSCLIITSTVTVNSLQTVLVDQEIRLKQYIDSILFYLKSKNISKIIVCDNSGFDYSAVPLIIKSVAKSSKEVEFLNFTGNLEKIREYGKGYGEGEIMQHIFNNSLLIKGREAVFTKVTGRLKITNIDLILSILRSDKSYFQPVNLNPFVKNNKVDTRFYQCQKNIFINTLLESFPMVNDNEEYFLEHVYYERLSHFKVKFSKFLILPNFLGVSGSTGLVYKMSNLKFLSRQFIYLITKNFYKS